MKARPLPADYQFILCLAAPTSSTGRVAGGDGTYVSAGSLPIRESFGVLCVRQVSASDRCDPAVSDNRAVARDPI